MLWNDFKKIKHYTVYINNVIWNFSFQEHRIIVNNKNNINIDGSPVLIYDVSAYETYYKVFIKIINDINNFYFCKKCNSFETDFCKICKLNHEVDKLTTDITDECPICYEKITVRYITICNDIRHKICQNCNRIDLRKCPICRNDKYKQQLMYNYNEEDDNNQYYEELNQNELSLHQSQELHQEIEHEVEQEANI